MTKERKVHLNTTVPKEIKKLVEEEAKKEKRSTSVVLELILEEYFENKKQNKN